MLYSFDKKKKTKFPTCQKVLTSKNKINSQWLAIYEICCYTSTTKKFEGRILI